MYLPKGFSVVTPYLFVDGVDDYVRFLQSAFGGHELGRSTTPDGRISNCQVRFSDATIMVSEASVEYPATRIALYLYVADADASMALAIEAGAVPIMDVSDMPYEDRQGGVRDPAGNIWWISQRLTAKPYY